MSDIPSSGKQIRSLLTEDGRLEWGPGGPAEETARDEFDVIAPDFLALADILGS